MTRFLTAPVLFLFALRAAGYKPVEGPYPIAASPDVVLKDASRHKDLHLRVQYPESGARLPVVIFSHGAGSSKDGYTALTFWWAAHGYVVIQPTHADSLTLRGLQNLPAAERLAAAAASPDLDSPAAWENRVHDLVLIMDSLDEIARQVPGIAGRMDTKRIGVGGHSFGAATTAMIGGAITNGKSLADSRPKALLIISGQGRDRFGFSRHSWDEMKVAMMTMTGSRDFGYKNQSPDWRREPYQFAPPGDKYDVYIEGANHMTFSGPAGVLLDSARAASLAFWDAYLKHSDIAKTWLTAASPTIAHK